MIGALLALALTLLPTPGTPPILRRSWPSQVTTPRDAVIPVRSRRGPRAPHRPAGARRIVAPHLIHVHDGDTFYVGGEAIRLRGIDTPELGQPRASDAKRRLIELLHAGPITIVRRAEDAYGRVIADVYDGGRNVARVLKAEGYAKPRMSRTRLSHRDAMLDFANDDAAGRSRSSRSGLAAHAAVSIGRRR